MWFGSLVVYYIITTLHKPTSRRIHNDLKDHVRDDEKRGNAQDMYRRLRNVIHLSNEEYAIELEAELTNIFKEGCKNKNVLQYGIAIKNKNDELKAVDQGFPETKLVLLYKKGLPQKIEVARDKLGKVKYNTLAKARVMIETYVRNNGFEELTFRDFKYKTDTEKKDYQDKKDKQSKENKQKEKRTEQTHNSNTKELECKYFKKGNCYQGKKCKFLHTNSQNFSKYDEKKEGNKSKTKNFPCYKFPDCSYGDKCKFSHDKKFCEDSKKKREENKHDDVYSGSMSMIDLTKELIHVNLTLNDEEEKEIYKSMNDKKYKKRRQAMNKRKKRTYIDLTTAKERPKVKKELPTVNKGKKQIALIKTPKNDCKTQGKNDRRSPNGVKKNGKKDSNLKLTVNTHAATQKVAVEVSWSEKTRPSSVSMMIRTNKEQRTEEQKDKLTVKRKIEVNMVKETLCANSMTETFTYVKTILDSGAMSHSVVNENILVQSSIVKVKNLRVMGVSGVCKDINKKGKWQMSKDTPDIQEDISLKDVIVIPESGSNIISVPKLSAAGYETSFTETNASVRKKGVLIITATLENRLFVVSNTLISNNSVVKNQNLVI
jgi:hypothetical protein